MLGLKRVAWLRQVKEEFRFYPLVPGRAEGVWDSAFEKYTLYEVGIGRVGPKKREEACLEHNHRRR